MESAPKYLDISGLLFLNFHCKQIEEQRFLTVRGVKCFYYEDKFDSLEEAKQFFNDVYFIIPRNGFFVKDDGYVIKHIMLYKEYFDKIR